MTTRPTSSPPCAMPGRPAGDSAEDVAGWRAAERRRLRALSRELPQTEREHLDRSIVAQLDALWDQLPAGIIAVYAPLPGEPDIGAWAARAAGRQRELALPVVVRRNEALAFHGWEPGMPMDRDVMGIRIPRGGKVVLPKVVIMPCTGFDRQGYRLGAGGGYYDRTFAVAAERPRLIGVAYRHGELRTVYPQPHDVPLHAVVTDAGTFAFDIGEPCD